MMQEPVAVVVAAVAAGDDATRSVAQLIDKLDNLQPSATLRHLIV